jgi:hypothetical protein
MGIDIDIKILDFLLHDPIGHRIDIEPDDVAAKAIGLQQGRSTPHEGISDL